MENGSNRGEKGLMEELLQLERERSRHRRLAAWALAAMALMLAVALLVTVPRAMAALSRTESSLARMDALMEEADGLLKQADSSLDTVDAFLDQAEDVLGDIGVMVENANGVIVDNTDAVTEAMQKLNSVDFENLNKAIEDLETAVKPLANLSRMLGN